MASGLRSIGRGGAGNYVTPSSRLEPQPQDDLEAQREEDPVPASPSTVPARPLSRSEYIHTGRGGAGNWGEPPEVIAAQTRAKENNSMNDQGGTEEVIKSAAPGSIDRTRTTTSPPPPADAAAEGGSKKQASMVGRGGAGNYYTRRGSKDQEAEAEREKQREKEEVRTKVRGDVEAQLEMPGKAFLGGKKAASGGGNKG